MLTKIKNKIFESLVNKNPVYKAAIKEGVKNFKKKTFYFFYFDFLTYNKLFFLQSI